MDLLNCKFDKSQTGLFVWGKLPEGAKGSDEFINDILYNAKVFITPGFIFGTNGEGFVRISLGSSTEKLQEAYKRIEKYITNN